MSQDRPVVALKKGARGKRVVILASAFNRSLTSALVASADATLKAAGVKAAHIKTVWVPGAFELPVAAAKVLKARAKPDAILALGVLIRGETSQYQVIAHAAAQGLVELSIASAIPITFGVIVAETVAQARARAGGNRGNRGQEAALAALQLLNPF